MSINGYLVELQRRHQALESQIQREKQRPSLDELKLSEMKRKKLLLKDEITRLSQQSIH